MRYFQPLKDYFSIFVCKLRANRQVVIGVFLSVCGCDLKLYILKIKVNINTMPKNFRERRRFIINSFFPNTSSDAEEETAI